MDRESISFLRSTLIDFSENNFENRNVIIIATMIAITEISKFKVLFLSNKINRFTP